MLSTITRHTVIRWRISFRVLLVVAMFASMSWTATCQERELDAKTALIRDMARLQLREAIRLSAETQIADIEDTYKIMMKSNMATYESKEGSRTSLQSNYLERLDVELAKQLTTLQTLIDPKGTWLEEEWLITELENARYGGARETAGAIQKKTFVGIFSNARAAAIGEVMMSINQDAYPSKQDFAELKHERWSKEYKDAKIEELVERIRDGKARVFEEVKDKVDKTAQNIVSNVEAQLKSQRDAIDEAILLPDAISRQMIHENIMGAVKAKGKVYGETLQEQGEPLYSLHPELKKRIEEESVKQERKLIRKYLSTFDESLNGEKIRELIEKEPSLHTSPITSLDKLTGDISLRNDLKDMVAEKFSSPVKDQERRTKFKDDVRDYLEDPEVEKETTAGFQDSLAEAMNASTNAALKEHDIRNEVAEAQLKNHFPCISDGTWDVEIGDSGESRAEMILEEFMTNTNAKIRGPVKTDNFLYFLPIPGLNKKGEMYYSSNLLDETKQLLIAKTQDLLREAARARTGQVHIVEKEKDSIIVAVSEMEDPAERVSAGISLVEKVWDKERTDIIWPNDSPKPKPANSATKYAALFNHTKVRIEEIVTPEIEIDTEPPIETIAKEPIPQPTKRIRGGDVTTGRSAGSGEKGGGGKGKGPGEGTGDGPGGGSGGGGGGGASGECMIQALFDEIVQMLQRSITSGDDYTEKLNELKKKYNLK